MRYEHKELASIGILILNLKIFVTVVGNIYTREPIHPTPASSLFTPLFSYELIEFASIGIFVVALDQFLEVTFPEYRLHKRILSISAVATAADDVNDTDGGTRGSSGKHKKHNGSSLNLSHSHNIGGINGFKLIKDLLCNPNRHLRELSLTRNCGINYETAKILAEGLSSSNNTSLEYLDIGINPQTLTHDALKEIVEALSSHGTNCLSTTSSSLRYLRLHGNRIDASGAELIGASLTGGCCGIEGLNLRDNMIGDEGVAFLADALSSSSCSSLTNLDVGRNRIGETGIKALCEMLLKNDTLQHLNLENNYVNDEATTCIVNVLKKNTTLRSLNLKDTSITAPGAESIALALSSNSTGISSLKELDLSCNRSMGEDGIEAIAKSLSKKDNKNNDYDDDVDGNTTLQILKLDGNRIRLQAAQSLHTMITSNSTLVQLNLRSCFIYDEAAELISDSLASSSCSLQSLNLQGNRIGVVGAGHLGRALTKNRSLTMLNLAFNSSLGEEGVLELGEALYGNSTLKVLNVAFNFDYHDNGNDGLGGGGCVVAQTLRKALFFPPLSKDNTDDDDDDDNDTSTLRRLPHDISDLQVGWSSNLKDTYPPLDIHETSSNNNNSNNTTVQICPCEKYRTSSVYGWTAYANKKDKKGHYPLQCAMQYNLKWRDGMPKLLEANYLAMNEENGETGLLPFMTAAVGDDSDWESVYRLLQQNPGGLVSYIVGR